ncbi:MAG: alpha/beta hydrolase [Pirellulales bacterium]|nr:alpha/beta hydrolase [Pirellulales bacterium]
MLSACILSVCLGSVSFAAEPKAQDGFPTEELLWPNGAPGALGNAPEDKPALFFYQVTGEKRVAAVVICPGGGYGNLAMGHEGHDIARWLNTLGINAFILDYRHRGKGYGHPAPLQDVQRAIRTVRARAEAFRVDPNQIGVMGFSAGGHLASTAATHFDMGNPESKDPTDRVSCRPDFAILCYPVIVFGQEATHLGSQRNLLGENPDPSLVEYLSNEKQVTDQTPPTFLFHTDADRGVPAENSVAFYLALRQHGVPAELHIYEHGRHGLGLASDVAGVSRWPASCADWLRGRGFPRNQ